MGLFGSAPSGPRFGRLARLERSDQFWTNRSAFDLIQDIQSLVSGGLQPGSFDTSQLPRAVPQDNPLLTGANQSALALLGGQGGLGSALQGALTDSLTQSGASLLDPALFNSFFNQSVAAPAQFDFDRALQQAAGSVASLGGERSGGFGTILGDSAREFGVNLLGQRAGMQSALQQQAAQLEAQRLGRVPQVTQAALAPAGFASALGEQQFQREGLRGSEDLSRFLMTQPFANPFVTQFLNIALGAANPGLIIGG